jgi:hypothetical protein
MKDQGSQPECNRCRDVEERSDIPHVVKLCEGCGRELRIVRVGKHGKGVEVQDGERFVIPASWLSFAANPLKGRGRLYRPGLRWFAELIFLEDLYRKESTYEESARALEDQMDVLVNSSPLVSPLDVNNPDHAEQIAHILASNRNTAEFWALLTGMFLAGAREARTAGEAGRASWMTACAERSRAMLVFVQHLEEVVWMGHSARRVIDALGTWDANRSERSEQFWQLTFNEHPYVLSQVFAVPVIFLEERAYVGGMKVDRRDAKFVDYLFSAESSREAILVEIKTPMTRLLGREYRGGVFAPSAEITGAVAQVLSQRAALIENFRDVVPEHVILQLFSPQCVVIAGNAGAELADRERRRSFELYRSSLDVQIVTYDELFRKLEILASLFSLERATPAKSEPVEQSTKRNGG